MFVASVPNSDRKVVLRSLKREFLADAKKRQTFETEIEFLQKIRNAQIPAYRDSCLEDQECLIVMDYVPGNNLAVLIEESRESATFFTPKFIFETFDQICALLEYLHDYEEGGCHNAIVHGDIKPRNILVAPDNKIYLIDFSVAMHYDPNKKITGGTYRYMSAEMYAGFAPSPQSDLFGAMLVLYEMLMLQPLIREKTLGAIFGYLLSGEHLQEIKRMRLRKPLEELLLKGLAPKPENRFSSAKKMAEAAREFSYTVPPSS